MATKGRKKALSALNKAKKSNAKKKYGTPKNLRKKPGPKPKKGGKGCR